MRIYLQFFFLIFLHLQFFPRKNIENGKANIMVCSLLISLHYNVCFSLISWKQMYDIHFKGKNTGFQGGLWKIETVLACQQLAQYVIQTADQWPELGVWLRYQ